MKNIMITLLFFISINNVSAQEGGDILDDSLKDFYTVFAVGAGGAILGLSTLSFADEPSKHLKNVWVGASMGVIIGVGIVAWSQASQSQNSYIEGAGDQVRVRQENQTFGTLARSRWHEENHLSFNSRMTNELPFFMKSYTF